MSSIPITQWVRCELCEDFYCSLHDQHAFECDCPSLDDFIAQGYDPYLGEFINQGSMMEESNV